MIFSWPTFRLWETKRWRHVQGSIWTSSNAAYSPASEVEIPYTCSQRRASWRTSRPSRSSRSIAVSRVWTLLAYCPLPLVRRARAGSWGSSRGRSRARTHSPSWLLQLWNIKTKTTCVQKHQNHKIRDLTIFFYVFVCVFRVGKCLFLISDIFPSAKLIRRRFSQIAALKG